MDKLIMKLIHFSQLKDFWKDTSIVNNLESFLGFTHILPYIKRSGKNHLIDI